MVIKKEAKECISTISYHMLREDIVIIPTDTVYGFSAIPSTKTKEKISSIKMRKVSKHLIYLIAKKCDALKYIDTRYYSKETLETLLSLWPNALTIIFKSILNEGTIALRYPDNSWLQDLIIQVGSPIFSTSANISGQATINNIECLEKTFNKDVPLIVDGGIITGSSSTILDTTCKPFKILRKGNYVFSKEILEKLQISYVNE